MVIALAVPGCIAVAWALAYHRANGLAWSVAFAAGAGALQAFTATPAWLATLLWALVAVFAAFSVVKPLRRAVVTGPIFGLYKRILPQVSQTEQEALDAGSVWWDADLFTGKPDWQKLLGYAPAKLSDEEKAFIEGPVDELCGMLDEWDITHNRMDLPPEAWTFIREKGFLGIIIPKSYGGLGFSAYAHSEIVTKISTRSGAAAVTVMVPNSLGPAELLIHYGTEAQKDHYLPRLAKGLEIPCFALTNPEAGSDAGSIPDFGIVCKGVHEGREVVGIRLTWEKRYITLGPVATILGLAFKLFDPGKLLGGEEELGITLALVPTSHKGVNIGRRHIPLNSAFMNGPTHGKDVFIPMDWVIGGASQVGRGWRMLVECLAAGRSISLPSMSMAAGKIGSRATGAYARVRSQFRTPIGRFEGVQEPLARIGGNTYLMDATRRLTMAALDMGEKPSVISAICKYHMTERMRQILVDAMDIHGGKGICLGPNNWVGRGYQVLPVGITVEGANILTRTLIIFGQGAIRCHPYVLREMKAAKELPAGEAEREFDDAFTSHIGHTLSNGVRAFVHGVTSSRLGQVPRTGAPETRHYYRFSSRVAAAFAFLADVSMLAMGGALKRKEKISGRLGDVLSMMYLISATLKHYEDQGRRREDLPLVRWSVRDAVYQAQKAIDQVLSNFPIKPLATFLRFVIFPFGSSFRPPLDSVNRECAKLVLEPGEARDRLTSGAYVSKGEDATGILEQAFLATVACEPIEKKLREAVRKGALVTHPGTDTAQAAKDRGIIGADELAAWQRKETLRKHVIKVDDFPKDFARAEIMEKLAPETLVKAKAA